MSSHRLQNAVVRSLSIGTLIALGLCRLVCGADIGSGELGDDDQVLILILRLNADRKASPGSLEPMLPLDIHNLTNAQPTLKTADDLFTSLLKDIRAIGANPSRVAGRKLSDLHIQLRQLRRAALDLQMLGETAGCDYSLRTLVLSRTLGNIVQAFKGTPAGQTYAKQARQFLSNPKAAQARKAAVQKLQRLMQEQKLEEAYTLLNEALDQLTSLTIMLEQREEELYLAEVAGVKDPIANGRNIAFRKHAQAALDQLAASLLPKTQDLLQSAAAAAGALRTAPQATVAGQTLAGPQCLEAFAAAWKQLHLSALRCRAVDWAYMTSIPDDMNLQQTGTPRIVDADYQRFYEDWVKALAALIEADAQRAAETEVPTLYVQYLQVLAPLVAATRDDKLMSAVQPALDKLAAKRAAFAAEVKAYVTATHELLRWRERTAQAGAAAAAATFPPSDQALVKFFLADGEYRGLVSESTADFNRALLAGSCPEVIPTASKRALEQPVLVKDIVGLSGGKLGVARYNTRHYATLPLPDVSTEAARLQQDLLVTAQQPALSLESAAAIDAAQHGNFVAAGGAVKGFFLEGLIPRFAALRPEAQQMVALGRLPAEVTPNAFINHVLVRLDVAPAWVQHKYFFLPLAAAPAAGNAP